MAEANIKAVITADDQASEVVRNFGRTIDKAHQQVGFFGRNIKAAGLMATGLVAGLGLSAKAAINNAAAYEQSRIAFDTMLGSASKAKAMLKEISDFAARTPFELTEVVTGAKQLLAYNILYISITGYTGRNRKENLDVRRLIIPADQRTNQR